MRVAAIPADVQASSLTKHASMMTSTMRPPVASWAAVRPGAPLSPAVVRVPGRGRRSARGTHRRRLPRRSIRFDLAGNRGTCAPSQFVISTPLQAPQELPPKPHAIASPPWSCNVHRAHLRRERWSRWISSPRFVAHRICWTSMTTVSRRCSVFSIRPSPPLTV